MPVVAGIDAFRDAMAGFEDKYVLNGGGHAAFSSRQSRRLALSSHIGPHERSPIASRRCVLWHSAIFTGG